MKKNNHALTVLLFAMLSICFSCKKNSTSSSTTSVEYQIIPMNVYFTKITYTDNTGNAVVITDPSQFANGIKSISVSTKPFNAKLETTINNTASSPISFTLSIKVDGEIKQYTQVNAPPMGTSTNSIEYDLR